MASFRGLRERERHRSALEERTSEWPPTIPTCARDDFTPEEQAEWDERTEHERVADVTGVGPYDLGEGARPRDESAPAAAGHV